MASEKWLRRGELARVLGTTMPTVKYYTALGLFPVHAKTSHGQHLYDPEAIRERFFRIKELKEKRLTIEEIKDRLKIETLMRNS